MIDAPVFAVVTPAASAAARRLTTAAKVQAVALDGAGTDTALIEALIDRASAAAASYCNLKRDASDSPATFGRETCRATWRPVNAWRGCALILPWRVPITSISSVVEDGVTLDASAYALRNGGLLDRLADDGALIAWSSASIVVTFVAGWDLTSPDATPPDIEAAVIEQVKAMYLGRQRDPALRSEATEGVGSASYTVAGGDSMGRNGLLAVVEAALDGLRAVPV